MCVCEDWMNVMLHLFFLLQDIERFKLIALYHFTNFECVCAREKKSLARLRPERVVEIIDVFILFIDIW